MINVTRWRPDTCKCDIEYSWDTEVPQDERVHTWSKTNKLCPAHINLTGKAHYDKVLEENQRKNKVHGLVLDNVSALVDEKTQDDGSTVKELKPRVKFGWSFDYDRNLIVDFTGMTAPQKMVLQDLVDTMFGSEKVRVV